MQQIDGDFNTIHEKCSKLEQDLEFTNKVKNELE